ncbi:hypothetical protein [Aeromicrobium sp. A1-2]|uniref:hypothetical protein n=1 Tax=Aeromicrobium sp. A1-2 TaxID=2107713 RepID=UPI0013C3353F|nr:hypothetical protein [Aeromicrobium sp. A1-2]
MWTRRRAVRIILPTTLLVAFVAEFLSREGPDYTIHSWIGIALISVIALHLAGNTRWIKSVWNRKREHREFGLGVLNATLGAVVAVCIGSGFPIWLDWSDATAWVTLHRVTGIASILLMFVHLWRNRTRIRSLVRPRVRRVAQIDRTQKAPR